MSRFNPNASKSQGRLSKAMSLHQQGRLAEARVLYEAVLKGNPRHFDALHLLGVIAFQTQNPQLAADLIGRAIGINPNIAEAHSNLGNALLDLKQYQASLKSLDWAIHLKPDFAEAHYNRGNALMGLLHYERALESYDRAIKHKPNYVIAFSNRGNALRELKQSRSDSRRRLRRSWARPSRLRHPSDVRAAPSSHGAGGTPSQRFCDALPTSGRGRAEPVSFELRYGPST